MENPVITPVKTTDKRFSHALIRITSLCLILILILEPAAQAAGPKSPPQPDPTALAISALQFGGSVGQLLWVSVKDNSPSTGTSGQQYQDLAKAIAQQIDLGRASSGLISANFNVVGTAIAYTAAADPEPLSKAVTGIAAWGAKKTGDAIGQMVIDQSQAQARAILAQGLQQSGLSKKEIAQMTATQLGTKVSDLRIGEQTLGEVLKNDPESLKMLQANAVDIATNIGVEAIARDQVTAKDVATVKQELLDTKTKIASFQTAVSNHLDAVNTAISGLAAATDVANKKLQALSTQVANNTTAIRAVAAIDYSGWSTSQKLQAVQSGLFPGLTDADTKALTESLQAELDRENIVATAQDAARDFGNLATIAGKIGLPPEIVQGLQGAQIAASAISQFASGNVLGGIAGLTSFIGFGGPDAEAVRYAQLMNYLSQQFAVVNQKLDKIIDLQVKTLQAIAALAEQQRQFQAQILGRLDSIQSTVLNNNQLLQAVLLSQWTKCYALINGTGLKWAVLNT